MDVEVEIKEEPVWLEGTANTSLGSFELVSVMPVKQETKSELTLGNSYEENFEHVLEMPVPVKQETKPEITEPEPTLENAFEPSADIKKEIFIEQHAVEQLDPYIKEKTNVENPAVLVPNCSICLKTFKSAKTLRQHSILHSDHRRFACTICGKTFKRASIMEQHTFRHSDIRLFSCLICGRTFKIASDLRSHAITHSDKYPYFCSSCEKSFKTKNELRRHGITHSDNRPFSCSLCGMTFKRFANFKEHSLRHESRLSVR